MAKREKIINWFIKSAQTSLNDNVFSTSVDVSLYCEKPGVFISVIDKKVEVKFTLDIEYRTWGIKDITLTPLGTIDINFEEEPENENIQPISHIINVDLTRLDREVYRNNKQFTVLSLDINLDQNLNVDYSQSIITTN